MAGKLVISGRFVKGKNDVHSILKLFKAEAFVGSIISYASAALCKKLDIEAPPTINKVVAFASAAAAAEGKLRCATLRQEGRCSRPCHSRPYCRRQASV